MDEKTPERDSAASLLEVVQVARGPRSTDERRQSGLPGTALAKTRALRFEGVLENLQSIARDLVEHY